MNSPEELIILQPDRVIPAGQNETRFQIVKTLHIGTNGISYEAIWQNKGGQKVFIKTPRVTRRQLMDGGSCQNLHHAFRDVLKRAQRIRDVDGVAQFISVDCFPEDDEVGYKIYIPFTVHQFASGSSLTEFSAKQKTDTNFIFCKTAAEWFKMAAEFVTIVKDFHNAQVAHGDIRPRNIHIDEKQKLTIVDFAEACLVDEEWRKSSHPTPDDSSSEDPYRAPEKKAGWDFPQDIYSIGGVLYYLACGEDPPIISPHLDNTAKEDVEVLKKAIWDGLKKCNPTLLNQNPGIARIIDKCRRSNTNDRYPYPESILSHIDIFNKRESFSLSSVRQSCAESVERVQRSIETLVASQNSQFSRILLPELLMLEKHIKGMVKGNHEIIGDREDLIDSLLRYLSLLESGNAYYTLTTPEFWSASNLGINGRFLTMNMVMAMRGVAIRRIFLLTNEEKQDDNVIRILQAHHEAVQQCQVFAECDKQGCPLNENDGYFTGYVIESEEKRRELIAGGYHTGVLKLHQGFLSINFMTRADNKTIGKVRFWASKDEETLLNEFRKWKPLPISNIVLTPGDHSSLSYAKATHAG